MALKLLYITNGIDGSGGLERVLSIKASYFAEELGYEVSIVVLNDANKNLFYNFSPKIKHFSVEVKGKPLTYFKAYRNGIQAIVNQIQPDVISVCDDGLKAFFLPKIITTKAKWIYERHVSKLIEANHKDHFFKKMSTKMKWQLMDTLAANFNHVVLLTEGNLNEWKGLSNTTVIPNPLSFNPKTLSSLNEKRILVVGRQAYQKGYDYLLNIWAIIEPQFPDWKLDVYGKIDPSLQLEELKTKLQLKNISFHQPKKNIQEEYLSSSIYWMTSRYEGFGMVLTEAMSYGLPCISFNCNYGPSDIIENRKNGFIIENFDINQFAQKTIELIENMNLRKELGLKSKQSMNRYAINEIAMQWDKLFKSQ